MEADLQVRLRARDTGELVEILRSRDETAWRPEVFPLVEAILRERGVDVAAIEAAGPPGTDEIEFVDLETVASFRTQVEASLCRMSLAQTGIEVWLSTENLAGISPPLAFATGVDVLVRAEDAESARDFLAGLEDRAERSFPDMEPCPRCGAADTDRFRRVHRVSALTGWFLAGTPIPMVDSIYRCRQCKHEWE
jgi:hypothetical protein